jgi:hypothetical protein
VVHKIPPLSDKVMMVWRILIAACSAAGLFIVFKLVRLLRNGNLEGGGSQRNHERWTELVVLYRQQSNRNVVECRSFHPGVFSGSAFLANGLVLLTCSILVCTVIATGDHRHGYFARHRIRTGAQRTVHLQRPYGRYGGVVYLKNQKVNTMPDISFSYADLLREIIEFMQTKRSPVANDETIEIFAFMDAAQRSLAQGGTLAKLGAR